VFRWAWLPTFCLAAIAVWLFATSAGGGHAASQPSVGPLFWTGYEDSTALAAPAGCSGRECQQYFTGTDRSTGHAWRRPARDAPTAGSFQLLVDAPVDARSVGGYIVNRIERGTGRHESQSLYSEIKRSGCCGTDPQGGGATQNPYLLEPSGPQGDVYLSYWLKLQPDLESLMGRCGPNIGHQWRVVFEWKAAGDYRVMLSIQRDKSSDSCAFTGPLYWSIVGDNNANCNLYKAPAGKKCPPAPTNLWTESNRSVGVPVDKWFKLEAFWHRSSDKDGRVWLAIDGEVIADHRGANTGDWDAPINRIMISQLYTSTAYPIFQRVDDLQIWQAFPTVSPQDSWYDPPYAKH
jgi:hypothetical protein